MNKRIYLLDIESYLSNIEIYHQNRTYYPFNPMKLFPDSNRKEGN
ncbi:hypothetical protein NSQ43_02565 [Sporosarcina sp. FSL W8-0480]